MPPEEDEYVYVYVYIDRICTTDVGQRPHAALRCSASALRFDYKHATWINKIRQNTAAFHDASADHHRKELLPEVLVHRQDSHKKSRIRNRFSHDLGRSVAMKRARMLDTFRCEVLASATTAE